jgi:predicted amidohydrolase YtcJ
MQAELVLVNGTVYTGGAQPARHEALAVAGGRIAALGSSTEAGEWAGPRTRTVDLGGRLVLPGFADAHLHPALATGELFEVRLGDCTSVEECLDRVARFAGEHPELPAVRGGGWYPTVVPMEGMTAAALDRVVPDRPVCLHDDNVHAQWVNTEMLRRAGVGREDPGWPGAVIERLPDGSPKGLLHEAFPWMERALPPYTVDQRVQAFGQFQREIASRYGITLLHEAGVYPDDSVLDAYRRLEDAGELSARLCLSLTLDPDRPIDEQVEAAAHARGRFAGPLVHAATVKLFVDGVIETHTGYLSVPYEDRPGDRGEPIWPPELLVEASVAAARAGFQLHYHVIGEAACSLALDAVAAAREAAGAPPGGARDLLTHLQLVDPRDYARMAELGVVAAVQPYWFTGDPAYLRELRRLVGARAERQYPMRSLLAAGVAVAGASDYPVSPPPDPLLAIQRGVLRRDPLHEADTELWPEEAVDVATMVDVFTAAGARANFLERETGSLEAGKSADLIVLRHDLFESPPDRIHEAAVELTVFRGRPAYAAGAFAGLASG